ncbi:MAG: glycosyltransferase family 2 protein [Firmicutes bacterium HGW-Firmicutes-5]|nr:MAG: glycosyltransferase family 2 protein [Firmicutes bacterium HGW-Firmicutes-5]
MEKYNKELTKKGIIVSVVMPVYNEELYIEGCIKSLLSQDYNKSHMEWIFVDGESNDATVSMIEKFQSDNPNLIKVYNNPMKTVPYAMNIGIGHAVGKYIIRLDAHSMYHSDYISKCVHYLETTDADNVGGVAKTIGKGFVGHTIALMLSSKFGVGNSEFRTGGKSGYVDTVPFGAFRRTVFDKYGMYNEYLTRNQDNEMNYRIRKNGGKIFLSDEIKLSYYCRDTIKGISDMALKNGKWNVITMKLCPGSMGVRHFIPLLFLSSLIIMPILSLMMPFFGYLFFFEVGLYLFLDLLFSLKAKDHIKYVPLLLILFPIFHITYGMGSMQGIIEIFKNKR